MLACIFLIVNQKSKIAVIVGLVIIIPPAIKLIPTKRVNKRDIVANGQLLQGHIESVEEIGGKFRIHCNARLNGQPISFSSPLIDSRPTIPDDKSIDIYVNPQKPKQYFVNYYDLIPYSRNGKLEDRSELKNEPCDVTDNTAELKGLAGAVAGLVNGIFQKEIEMCVRLLKNGDYLEADVYNSYDVSGDDSTTYYIKLHYIEPGTKRAHEFLACSGHANIKKLVGTKVRVYVNPDDTHEFIVDYIRALEDMGFTVDENDKKRALNMFDIYESGILPARKKD